MNFLFLSSAWFSNFSQYNHQLNKLDSFFYKLEEKNSNLDNLMLSDKRWNDFSVTIKEAKPKILTSLYDPLNEKSEIYDEIFQLERKLTEVMEKIKEAQMDKETSKEDIGKLTKNGKCNKKCKTNTKEFKKGYEKYKSWLEDCKGEKDRLMSELAKYHKKKK